MLNPGIRLTATDSYADREDADRRIPKLILLLRKHDIDPVIGSFVA
jgi:hypothetical protein